jgi:hypothetical protein
MANLHLKAALSPTLRVLQVMKGGSLAGAERLRSASARS